jgi:hypothetical protein
VAKLGSNRRPAHVRVRSHEKSMAVIDLCNKHNWKVIVGIASDAPEDLSDLEKLFASTTACLNEKPRVSRGSTVPMRQEVQRLLRFQIVFSQTNASLALAVNRRERLRATVRRGFERSVGGSKKVGGFKNW